MMLRGIDADCSVQSLMSWTGGNCQVIIGTMLHHNLENARVTEHQCLLTEEIMCVQRGEGDYGRKMP